jgi:hypothetical protein
VRVSRSGAGLGGEASTCSASAELTTPSEGLQKEETAMTIVTTRPRKRASKPARAATIKVPRIVQHTPKGRTWTLPEPDPGAVARAYAFLERMGINTRKTDV